MKNEEADLGERGDLLVVGGLAQVVDDHADARLLQDLQVDRLVAETPQQVHRVHVHLF